MTPQIKERIEQIQRGEVPEGYKKSKAGVVPVDWEEIRFKKMFSRVARKNKENNDNVLTISAQYGLISQRDFFNKDIASEDKSNYYLLYNGEFAYNKSYSTGYPYGALKRLDLYDKGIVSPLYICFAATKENRCPEFYVQYFEAGKINREIQAFAQEGARNHGLLNIAVDDFFNSNIVAPSFAEQEKVAEILCTQDKVIALKEKLLEEKKRQKKYLMQQILNNKTVKSKFSSHWNTVELKDVFEYIQPTKYLVESTDYSDAYSTPVLTAGKSFILGYTNETDGIYNQGPVVIFDDFTTDSKYVNFPFKAKSSAMKILKAKANYDIRFAFELLQNITYAVGGHERHWISIFSQLIVDVPPYEAQLKIVEIIQNADQEIALLKKDLDQEKQKKKALMQLLLTGIVRVNI